MFFIFWYLRRPFCAFRPNPYSLYSKEYKPKIELSLYCLKYTLFEIFIFCPKIQLWFPEKIVDFFSGWKTRENVVVLDFVAVDNFDFTRKLSKKFWMKNSCKYWGFVKIEFLDKNLTFRIVWLNIEWKVSEVQNFSNF